MKKFLLTACSVVMLMGCSGQNSYRSYEGNDMAYIPQSTFRDLEDKVGATVFFAYDSSELTSEAKSVLDRQVQFMKQNPKLSFVIEGHCDKRGTVEYNLALGERRANGTKDYLVSHGIASDRFTVISFGKERPAVEGGDTEEIYKQNRRTVTVIR